MKRCIAALALLLLWARPVEAQVVQEVQELPISLFAQAADANMLAYRDSLNLSPDEKPYTRYLWISEEIFPGDPKSRWMVYAAVSGHLNGMSLKRKIVTPTLILADGSTRDFPNVEGEAWAQLVLLRVNIFRYGWDPVVWDRLGNPSKEPIFHAWNLREGGDPKSQKAADWTIGLAPWLSQPLPLKAPDPIYLKATVGLCVECGYCKCPILEASNFVWQTAIQFDRRAGYYDFQGIKNLDDFNRVVAFDRAASIKYALPLLEAVTDSDVAEETRRIEVFEKLGGKYILTKDIFKGNPGGQRDPVNAKGQDELDFDAFEIFATAPNGWWKVGLFAKDGTRQDSAPDGIGYHKKTVTNDGRIHINLTCFTCHDNAPGNGGLRAFRPYFRSKYAVPGPLAATTLKGKIKELAGFEEQYLTPIDLAGAQQVYAAAVFTATGTTPDRYASILYEVFYSWDRRVSLEIAAQRLAVSPALVIASHEHWVRTQGWIDDTSDNWLLAPPRRSKLTVAKWAEAYHYQQLYLRGLPQWPASLKQAFPVNPAAVKK